MSQFVRNWRRVNEILLQCLPLWMMGLKRLPMPKMFWHCGDMNGLVVLLGADCRLCFD